MLYTGKLFGYYRYPDVQTTADRGCPAVASTALPSQVQLFAKTLKGAQLDDQALVSMGEDFAPELLARSVKNTAAGESHRDEMIAKGLLMGNGGGISADNVGCFLRLMGFDAIVPGAADFYYGPEYLREMARFLFQPAIDSYRPVAMLGANLIIHSSVRQQAPRLPAGELRPHLRDALDSASPVHFNLPSSVLPWLREVAVTPAAPGLRVYDCPASLGNPQAFKLPDEKQNRCVALPASDVDPSRFRFVPPAQPSDNFISRYQTLDPGSNHALCAASSWKGEPSFRCQLFSVEYPFFEYRPSSPGLTPPPYLAPASPSKPVIFGVVDPGLADSIGQLNGIWKNTNPDFDTEVQVVDPIESLRQALALCDADGACKGRRKILLAQMPDYKAAELAARVNVFDLVIAQPDRERATGEEASSSQTDENNAPHVLTPGVAFEASRANPLGVNLRRADFYMEGQTQRFLANRVYDRTLPVPPGGECRSCALDEEVGRATAQPPGGKAYELLALTSMREFCHADAALIQHRDVFPDFGKAVRLWPQNFPVTPQLLLKEALWKGDFAFCLPVQGATLKKVLSESAAFDKQDQDNLSITVERGRGLSTLGIEKDPNSNEPTIRGEALQDKKLYGVAMTDYLAFGDTGYPELSSEAVRPLVRIISLQGLNSITGLACQNLPVSVVDNSCQSGEISAKDYFAAIRQKPFDTSRGVTAWLELRKWATTPFPDRPLAATLLEPVARTPQQSATNRAMWWLTLQNISLGYNLNFIRGSDADVPVNFVGNNNFSQLSAPESAEFIGWLRARGGYSFSRFVDFYVSAELKYDRATTRLPNGVGGFGAYQLNLASNLLRNEVGIISKPVSKRAPFRFLASENVLTQIDKPFQQFTVPVACGDLPCGSGVKELSTFPLQKTYLVLTRAGARLQNQQSWIEAGREYGSNIGVPSGYSLIDPGNATPFPCPVMQGLSLGKCLTLDPYFTNRSRVATETTSRSIAGWFLNFRSVAPLYHNRLQLTADSYGELFDREATDTFYNTRFYEDATLSLQVPVWGNLSFAPRVEVFVYQSKVVPDQLAIGNHYVFVSTSLTLQYGFDWHRGVGLLRSLGFANGVETSSTATTSRP